MMRNASAQTLDTVGKAGFKIFKTQSVPDPHWVCGTDQKAKVPSTSRVVVRLVQVRNNSQVHAADMY